MRGTMTVGVAGESTRNGTRPVEISLRRNISWTFAGNAIYAACQWGMLVVLARLGSTEVVGQFTLGLAIAAPVIMFANLQLRGIQATDARGEYEFSDYLGLRILTTAAALLVILGIVVVSGYGGATAAVIVLMALAKAAETISDAFYGLQQQHERMRTIALSMIVKGIASLAVLGVVMALTHSVVLAVVGLAVARTVVLVTYDVRRGLSLLRSVAARRDALRPRWDVATLRSLAWTALPLGVTMGLLSLNTNIPRYIIEREYSTEELGVFAALAYLIVLGTTVVGAMGQSMSPRLARYYAAGDRLAFTRLLWRFSVACLILGIGGVAVAAAAGEWALGLVYGPVYAAHAETFVLLMMAAGVAYVGSSLGYGMTAARRFAVQAPLFLGVAAVTLVASLALIPRFGINGAALAILVASVVQLAGSAAIVARAVATIEGTTR